jgi:hypothetical protein
MQNNDHHENIKPYIRKQIHQGLVSCPSCVPEKVGANQDGVNKKCHSHQKYRVGIIEHSQPKGIK